MIDNYPRPIRVLVFPDRPDAILIYVPEGETLWLPRMQSPFGRHEVAQALGEHDIPARVGESVPGRFTSALGQAFTARKAEEAQRNKEAHAASVARHRCTPAATTYEAKRRELVDAKSKVDEELRDLKEQLGRAKAKAATSGEYLPVAEYRTKTARVADLQNKSLAIQHQLGQLRKAEKEIGAIKAESRDRTFINLMRERMTRDEWIAAWSEVDRKTSGDEP